MFRQGRYPARLAVAGIFLAAVACGDLQSPTAVQAPSDQPLTAQVSGARVKIRKLQLSANTLRLDGPAVIATLGIANNAVTAQPGVSIRVEIAQPGASRQSANVPVQCLPGDAPGFLPLGNCDMSFPFSTSNSAPGSGLLEPGAAVLTLRLLQTVGQVETELDVRSIDVNLVATPTISALALTSTTLVIDGPPTGWTATLQNPAKSLQNVSLQGTIVQTLQGTTRRAAGGVVVQCGSAIGLLAPGTCTVTFAAVASNDGSGSGTLMPGAADLELRMSQTVNGVATVLDTRTVAITLISSTPTISSLVLATTSFVIGTSVNYTVQIQNPGVALSEVILQGEMTQTTANGTVVKGAGGTTVLCGAGLGNLPTGTCTIQFTAIALDNSNGGAFESGPASFVLYLYKGNGTGPTTELDAVTVPVTLASPNPTITSFTPTSTDIVLGSGFTSFTAVIENPGATLSIVGIQSWIRQGTARRAAAGGQVRCNGSIVGGELPTGTCTTLGDIVAANGQAAGTGTLVLGDAILEVELKYYDGVTDVILETKTYAIKLVSP